jgi:hypothetical protein
MQPSKVFISYSWEDEEHKNWVRDLSVKLRKDGVDVKLDQWELTPGDQLPQFMERMITENDYILVVCTPNYKTKSDTRSGGVGYEGDIMTGLKLSSNNQRKFIPIIRKGDLNISYPLWLSGVFGLDFRNDLSAYEDLHATLTNSQIRKAPPLGRKVESKDTLDVSDDLQIKIITHDYKILGIITDEVEFGKRDGTRGSGLDKIPFLLNDKPDQLWIDMFLRNWNHPSSFSSMHRPNIASIVGNKLFLNGTTIEEIRDYHRNTLKVVINDTNFTYRGFIDEQISIENANKRREQEQKKNIDDIAKGIKFD